MKSETGAATFERRFLPLVFQTLDCAMPRFYLPRGHNVISKDLTLFPISFSISFSYCVEQGLIEARLALEDYLLRDSTDESGLEVLKSYEDAGVTGPRFDTRVIHAQ